MATYNVQNLPAYVEQHRSELIGQTVLGPDVTKYFDLWTGIKGDTTINVIEATDDMLQCGAACGWSSDGEVSLSQRTIKPGIFKVNLSICDKNLLNKYAGYLVRVEAGKTDRDLPFEQELVDEVIKNVKNSLTSKIFNGNATAPADCGMQGLMNIQDITSIDITGTSGSKEAIEKIVAAMACANIKSGEIFLSCSDFTTYVTDLVNANLYHFNPGQAVSDQEVFVPGTNYRLVVTDALAAGEFFASASNNIVLGVNMENGEEQFDIWYSKDNREFRLAIEFVEGVQVKNPDLAFKVA